LAAGVYVNAKGNWGSTPLHYAAQEGHMEVAELLIADGADLEAKADTGITPPDWAYKYPEIANLLRKHGGKYGTIHVAARGGDIEAVKEFLAAGADVDAKDKYGRTPLHRVAYEGHKAIVELLIAKGADVDAKDEEEWTPLYVAAMEGQTEVAELLIAEGADVDAKNKYGDTPLNTAISYKHPETADLLRKHGGKTGEELKVEGK
jgi:ankyrin repeat protein